MCCLHYDKITIDEVGSSGCGRTRHLPAVRRRDAQNEEDREQRDLATGGRGPVYLRRGRPVLRPSGHHDRTDCYDLGLSAWLFEAEGVIV